MKVMLIKKSNLKQMQHVLMRRMKNVAYLIKTINKYNGPTCINMILIFFCQFEQAFALNI